MVGVCQEMMWWLQNFGEDFVEFEKNIGHKRLEDFGLNVI